jgi:hypothetical protein
MLPFSEDYTQRWTFKGSLWHFWLLVLVSLAVVIKTLGLGFWWLGACLALVSLNLYGLVIHPGYWHLKNLSQNRLKDNLNAMGLTTPARLFPFHWYQIGFVVLLGGTLLGASWAWVETGLHHVVKVFQPESLVLRIEYPTYANKPASELRLEKIKDPIEVEQGSLIHLYERNKRNSNAVSIIIQLIPQEGQNFGPNLVPYTAQLKSASTTKGNFGQSGSSQWTMSTQSILNTLLGQTDTKSSAQSQSSKAKDFEKIYKLLLEVKSDQNYPVEIKLLPYPRPLVHMEVSNAPDSQTALGPKSALQLSIEVQGTVSLSNIVVKGRTTSGYTFQKNAGEFSGSQTMNFKIPAFSLNLFGIPFKRGDSLMLKTVAQTVVPELWGESKELEIKIKTPLDARAEVMTALKESLSILESKVAIPDGKEKVLEKLQKAQQLSSQLGFKHRIHKQLPKIMDLMQSSQTLGDMQSHQAKAQIKSLLEKLEKQQQQDEMNDLFTRLNQLHKKSLSVDSSPPDEMAKESQELSLEFQKLKGQLRTLVEKSQDRLSASEQDEALKLLKKDQTDPKLQEAANQFQTHDSGSASTSIDQAKNEAERNLGVVAGLLQMGQRRAREQAKQNLAQADQALESSKSEADPNPSVKEATQKLKETPKLGDEFDTHLESAKKSSQEALEAHRKKERQLGMESTDKSQEAIVRALESLQETEQEEQESTGQMEAHQRELELLNAESALDNTWRKNILDEISQLKEKGLRSQDPLIQMLENKLR